MVKTVTVSMEHPTPSIKAHIDGAERSLITDTGSDVSILQPVVSNTSMRSVTLRPYGVTGETLDVKGRQTVSLGLRGRMFDHTFLVCPLPMEAAGLLGTDFLEERGAHINFENAEMSFNDAARDSRAHGDTNRERRVLTIFTLVKEGHRPQPMLRTEERRDEHVSNSPQNEEPTSQSQTRLVKASENILLAPRCRPVAVARLQTEKEQNLPPFVYVEPAQILIEGIFLARTLSRVNPSTHQSTLQTSQCDDTVMRSTNSVYVMLANFSEETLTMPKHTVLGITQQVSEALLDKVNARGESDVNSLTGPSRKRKNEALYEKLLP